MRNDRPDIRLQASKIVYAQILFSLVYSSFRQRVFPTQLTTWSGSPAQLSHRASRTSRLFAISSLLQLDFASEPVSKNHENIPHSLSSRSNTYLQNLEQDHDEAGGFTRMMHLYLTSSSTQLHLVSLTFQPKLTFVFA